MTTFTAEQMDSLRAEWAKLNGVNPDRLPEFHQKFASMTDDQLIQIATGRIKFLSPLALNACRRRGLNPLNTPAAPSDVACIRESHADIPKAQGDRVAVIVRYFVSARRSLLAVQYWTPAMIERGTYSNGDGLEFRFVETL